MDELTQGGWIQSWKPIYLSMQQNPQKAQELLPLYTPEIGDEVEREGIQWKLCKMQLDP